MYVLNIDEIEQLLPVSILQLLASESDWLEEAPATFSYETNK